MAGHSSFSDPKKLLAVLTAALIALAAIVFERHRRDELESERIRKHNVQYQLDKIQERERVRKMWDDRRGDDERKYSGSSSD